ncbi:MAG: leucine-rich repeat protein [Eubacteriales bacterium]|nr:leucine-rich repeat protein [Eubacteriales bacterium]
MKPLRKILGIAVLVALLAATLSACDLFGKKDPTPTPTPNPGGNVQPPKPDQPQDISDATSGLKYKLTGNSYSVVGILSTNTRTDVVVPETYNGLPVDTIGYNAFEGATKIKTLTLGENVTSVGDFAFKGCTALRTINLNKVNSIGNGAFRGCKSLQFVTVSEDNEHYFVEHNVLYNKNKTTLVLYPTSNYEFDNFSIPKSVDTIRGGAFEGEDLQLEIVLIGANVKEVSYNAFIDCKNLKIYYIPDADGGIPAGWNENWHNLSEKEAADNISAFNGRECTITFDSHGGSEVEAVLQYEKFYISTPETPIREGYRFDGWYLTDSYLTEQKVKFPYQVDGDRTLHAKWVKRCTIKFDTKEGGTEIPDVVQDEGYTVAKPADPTRENYRFAGWYLGGSEYNFDSVVSQDLTIEAKWVLQCYLVFDLGYGEESNVYYKTAPKDIGLTVGTDELKKNPSRAGFKFMGWYTEKDGQGTKIEDDKFPYVLEKMETVFYAYWKESFTIVFDADNETSETSDVAVLKGDAITEQEAPDTPVYENYRFDGWFSERNGGGTEFRAGETVFADDTPKKYYAKWVRQYVVTIDTNGGPQYGDPFKVDTGSKLSQPNASYHVKKGHDFVNWQIDGVPVDFDTYVVEKDVTLVATYEAQQYNVIFIAETGEVIATVNGNPSYAGTFEFGSTITAESLNVVCPTETHRFVEWTYGGVRYGNYDEDGKFVDFTITEEYPDGLTLTAKWQRQYRVTLVSNESESTDIFVDEGNTLNASDIDNPSQYGYVFEYWLDGETRFESMTMTEDILLKAKWHLDTFKITYRIEGQPDEINEIEYLTKIHNFLDPVIDGFVVSRWTHEDGSAITMPYVVEGDETIVAVLTAVVENENYFNFILKGDEYSVSFKDEFKTDSTVTAIKIPDTHNGKPVSRVAGRAFLNAVYLEKVELGANVVAIESGAFMNCSGLKVMSITAPVNTIKPGAFAGCTRLTRIAVSDSNTCFTNDNGDGILYEINSDDEYVLVAYPAGRSDETVTVSTFVGEIRSYAFDGASRLKVINIERDNAFGTIGTYAFNGCSALEAVNVNNSAYVSVDGVLYTADEKTLVLYPQNKAGDTFTVPDTVTKIARRAFRGNNNLVEIVIGANVSALGDGEDDYEVFGEAKKLERFAVDAANQSFSEIRGVLYNKAGTVLRFYPSAKSDMTYVVESTAEKICLNAFAGAINLSVLYIPKSVVTVSGTLFAGAERLTTVYVGHTEAELPSGWNYDWKGDLQTNANVVYGAYTV